jgi:hypothetical protein
VHLVCIKYKQFLFGFPALTWNVLLNISKEGKTVHFSLLLFFLIFTSSSKTYLFLDCVRSAKLKQPLHCCPIMPHDEHYQSCPFQNILNRYVMSLLLCYRGLCIDRHITHDRSCTWTGNRLALTGEVIVVLIKHDGMKTYRGVTV